MKLRNWVMCAVLLVLLMPTGAAAQSLTAKEAAELVRERITVPSDMTKFTSNYYEYEGRGQWEFQWTGNNVNLNAVLDVGTGDVTSFYGYGDAYSGQQSLLPKVTKSEALATAQAFLKKAAPSTYGSLRLADYAPESAVIFSYNRDYSFYFERMEKGVPCSFNGAELMVSSTSGKVTSFYLNWDFKNVFPTVKTSISAEKAGQIMQDKGFELMYFLPNSATEGRQEKVKLVYGVSEPRRAMVDAITGDFVVKNNFYTFIDMYSMGGMGGMDAQAKENANNLTPIEEEEVAAVASLISKEKAQEAVYKYFKLPQGFKLDNVRLFEDEKKMRVWSLGWTMEDQESQRSGYMSASVNAQTGEVLSYAKWINDPSNEKQSNQYTVSEAKAIGEKLLKTIQPAKMGQVRYVDRQYYSEDSRTVGFNYVRLVNGIPFYENSLSVEVDRVTGEATSFNVQWGDFVFPKASPAIDPKTAYAALTKTNPFRIGYLRIDEYKNDRQEQKIGLYYYFGVSQPRLVDAGSGKVLLDTGKEYVGRDMVEFTDISGSPYEKDIKLLLSLGVVGDTSSKFNPEADVVGADFIKMLVLASGWQAGEGDELKEFPDTWYRPYYQTAVYHGVLSKENLPKADQAVNRMDCARYLVNAMGLKKAAVLEGIYKVPVKDSDKIADKDAGYAAIALKMGLLADTDGSFEANTILTRGQAASILVKYMKTF